MIVRGSVLTAASQPVFARGNGVLQIVGRPGNELHSGLRGQDPHIGKHRRSMFGDRRDVPCISPAHDNHGWMVIGLGRSICARMRRRRAGPPKRTPTACRGGTAAEFLTMLSQQAGGCYQRLVVLGEHRSQRLLRATIRGAVVLRVGREPEATEDAQSVGVQRKQPSGPGNDQDLVGARLSNHGEPSQGAARLSQGELQRGSKVAIPVAEHQLSRRPKPRGSGPDRNRPTQTGDGFEFGRGSGKQRPWLKAHFVAKGQKGAASLAVGHQIPDLFPENQLKGVATDRSRGLPVVAPKRGDDSTKPDQDDLMCGASARSLDDAWASSSSPGPSGPGSATPR